MIDVTRTVQVLTFLAVVFYMIQNCFLIILIFLNVGKRKPKKPIIKNELYCCPGCGDDSGIIIGDNYCSYCGQALDWGDEE